MKPVFFLLIATVIIWLLISGKGEQMWNVIAS